MDNYQYLTSIFFSVPLMMGELNGVDKQKMDMKTSTMSERALLHRTQQPIEQKCFVTEVRGIMDINNLLEKSSIILDLQASAGFYHY